MKVGHAVDLTIRRLDILAPLLPVRDIRLSGQVIYTGTSSMEVAVKMEAINPDRREETLMLGKTDITYMLSLLICTHEDDFRWYAETLARVRHIR